jgi:GAF domain-containing protein
VPAVVDRNGISALASPLHAAPGGDPIGGVVSIARAGEPFSEAERELFEYLARQAGVSMENVRLHETVERQAVTDELTGLANRRRFQETLATEIERARRFETSLALVMLDIDNFKRVNDTYGTRPATWSCARSAGSCASPRVRSTPPRATAARSSR